MNYWLFQVHKNLCGYQFSSPACWWEVYPKATVLVFPSFISYANEPQMPDYKPILVCEVVFIDSGWNKNRNNAGDILWDSLVSKGRIWGKKTQMSQQHTIWMLCDTSVSSVPRTQVANTRPSGLNPALHLVLADTLFLPNGSSALA